MNLVQKLSIGLSLACMMMLSSCSKEDVKTPEPQVGGVNESSGLRQGNNPIELLPQFAPTIGNPGLNTFPLDWKRNTDDNYSNDSQALPIGLSTLTHLWGNPFKPWTKLLAAIPGTQDMGSILTISTATNNVDQHSNMSSATTKIKYLQTEKVYSIDFYISTTVNESIGYTTRSQKFAKSIWVKLNNAIDAGPNGGPLLNPRFRYDFFVPVKWFKHKLIFKAKATEVDFSVAATTDEVNQYSYAHIFVDKNSIKEVN